jgi:hypothetical protein
MAPYVGLEDAEFLMFLRDETPENATIYFFDTHGIYSWKPFLQYSLFPRNVNVCNEVEIELCIGDGDTDDILIQTEITPLIQNDDIEFSFTPFRNNSVLGYYSHR